MYIQSSFLGGIKYCSSLECTIDGWIYILYEKQKWDKKTKRLSSCSDHLVQYCTKKWKGQTSVKGEMQVMGSGFSHFTLLYKTRQKKTYEPYKHGYLLWNCHSFELKKVKTENLCYVNLCSVHVITSTSVGVKFKLTQVKNVNWWKTAWERY